MHINLREVIAEFDEIEDRVGDLTPVLKKIGVYMVQRAKKRFADSGPGWPPLSPATIARRRGGSPKPLWDTGRLLSSIGILTSDRKEVKVGTNVIYAAIHNFGGRAGRGHRVEIPARPFLYVEDRDVDVFKEIILRYLMGGES